ITLEGLDSLSPASTVEARKNAEAIVRVQDQANVARLGRERDHAKNALEEANARFADASDREEAIRKEMDSPLRPNYLQTTFYTVCAATALSCEYALCYQTLPPLLGAPLETWQAYALGAAPVAAAVAIEMILDYLYGVIGRLEAMTGRWVSGIAAATLILCALGVLLLNGKMVWAVAFAREEAARLLTTLADYTETPLTINQDI